MPLPHILYSALSVCRALYHLVSDFVLYFLGGFPAMDAQVSRAPCQNSSSSFDSLSLWSGMPQPSGNPCKRQHSSGVRRRMMYLRGGLSSSCAEFLRRFAAYTTSDGWHAFNMGLSRL